MRLLGTAIPSQVTLPTAMKSTLLLMSACALMAGCARTETASAVAPTPGPAASIVLAQNGKSAYTIALASDAIPAEKTAAGELQKYLQQVTGVKLVVRPEAEVGPAVPQILVGAGKRAKSLLPKQDWDALGSDGIVIKTVGRNLVLAGGRPRGSLYAVFQFLEDNAGCRWWTPEASRIPQKKSLTVSAQNVVYRSPFDYREHYATAPYRDAFFATTLRENGHQQTQTAEWGGHYRMLGWVHTFEVLLPQTKYFKDHPEWYTDPNNGNKPCTSASKMPEGQLTQLCLSNPEALAELTRQALLMIEKEPEAGYISISQNDSDTYCRCPDCTRLFQQEGSEAGPVINFVNQVAAGIHERYPNFMVETLAYRGSENPPKTIRPAKNVLIRLAPIYADFGHPYDSEFNKKARDNVKQWAKIAPHLFIWNYITNFNSSLMPHPNWDGLAKDVRFFAANNVIGVFQQGNAYTNDVGDFAPLRTWLTGKLMWNPKLDQAKLTDEFMQGYYGPAAPFLKRYIDLVQAAFHKKKMPLSISNRNFSFLTLGDMNRATRLFDQAAIAVKGDKEREARLQRERISLDLAWLVRYKALKAAAAQPGQEFLGPADGPKALAQFVSQAKGYGVELWGEAFPLEKQLPVIEAQFRPVVALPDFARKFAPEDVIDIQDNDFRMHERGKVTEFVDDAASSDGKVATIIGDTHDWAINAEFYTTDVSPDPENWHIYALARADLKPGAKAEGIGFNAGIYDDVHTPKAITSQTIPLSELVGTGYKLIDLGVKSVRRTSYLWIAPQKNPAAAKFYVDRVILVRENAK